MTVLVSSATFRSYLGTGTPDSTTYFRGDGTWQSAITATSLTTSGNLAFTSTGNKITGDFSNATLTNRVLFQTSTTNGNTAFSLVPNGTSVTASFHAYSTADPTNSSRINFAVIGGSEVTIRSDRSGTGTLLPMTFYTGGVQAIAIDTTQNFYVGTAALATTATTGFPWIPSCAGTPTGAPTAPYTNAAAMVADTTNSRLYVLIGGTWKYAALV